MVGSCQQSKNYLMYLGIITTYIIGEETLDKSRFKLNLVYHSTLKRPTSAQVSRMKRQRVTETRDDIVLVDFHMLKQLLPFNEALFEGKFRKVRFKALFANSRILSHASLTHMHQPCMTEQLEMLTKLLPVSGQEDAVDMDAVFDVLMPQKGWNTVNVQPEDSRMNGSSPGNEYTEQGILCKR